MSKIFETDFFSVLDFLSENFLGMRSLFLKVRNFDFYFVSELLFYYNILLSL